MNRQPPQDLRQSPEYASYMEGRGWEVEKISCQRSAVNGRQSANSEQHQANAFIKKIPLVGSVIKIQHPAVVPSEEKLDNLAKKYCALFIKIEPHTKYQILNTKYQPDTWPLLPSKTLQLDLTKPEEELWRDLDQDARYSIKRAGKSVCVMRYALCGSDFSPLKTFYSLLKNTGKSKHFYTPKWRDLKLKAKRFNQKAWLVLATERNKSRNSAIHCALLPALSVVEGARTEVRYYEHKKEPRLLAGCLLLVHDNVAYYHHAANSPEGRKLLAGYLVLWEAIKLAKSLGCHTFDFEGIYDPRFPKATRDWKGFTRFKKKFGGKEIEFPHPLIKYYSLPFKLLAKLFG